MRHGRKAFVAIVLIAVLFAAWQLVDRFALTPAPPAFRFTAVERGDVQAVVSATGTLQAVTTVSVGTQVSGQVSALYVDFNTEVKKGSSSRGSTRPSSSRVWPTLRIRRRGTTRAPTRFAEGD